MSDGSLSKLATELKKRKPFEAPEEEAYLNLLRTCQWLQHDTERLLKPHGLSEATYNVLRILRGVGEGVPSLEIASRMVTRVPDVTRLVDRLIRAGYASRERTETDRRIVLVSITDKGMRLLEHLDGPLLEQVKRQFALLSRNEMKELSRLLEKAREATVAPCESPADHEAARGN